VSVNEEITQKQLDSVGKLQHFKCWWNTGTGCPEQR